jgi:hypothetical protein
MIEWIAWVAAGIIVLFGFVVFRGAPYVPSHRRDVNRAFDDLYPLTDSDVLVDVGSGDGVVLRLAAARGAKAVGYELNPALVVLSRLLSRRATNVSVRLADFWLVPLPADTTVVYGFIVTRDVAKMAQKLQRETDRLGRPLYFVSYGNELKGLQKVGEIGAHHLYRFNPLHRGKAQV